MCGPALSCSPRIALIAILNPYQVLLQLVPPASSPPAAHHAVPDVVLLHQINMAMGQLNSRLLHVQSRWRGMPDS